MPLLTLDYLLYQSLSPLLLHIAVKGFMQRSQGQEFLNKRLSINININININDVVRAGSRSVSALG